MNYTLNIKTFLKLILAFMLFSVIGTLSHEYGHVLVAKYYGYDTTLHYSSMNYSSGPYDELANLRSEDPAEQNEYDKLLQELQSHAFWISVGGPLQTTLTGTFGLMMVYIRRKQIREIGLQWSDWLSVFLSLFWLREVFNLALSIGTEMFSPNGHYFGGDELYISQALEAWEGTISIILGFAGLLVTSYILFSIIPNRLRVTFIVSGLIGGILGYLLWMNFLGPLWLT